jgi:DNA repair photolyase
LSPGLDFETQIFVKPDAPRLLAAELGRKGYRPEPIHLGANTDPYQPVERETGLTRAILQVLLDAGHPVTVLTKGALIERDVDLLAALARRGLARAAISITTLDPALKRTLEPRAASPQARLRAIRTLTAAGVPTAVMAAPVIPRVNDHELEAILEAAAQAGATHAGWILLRLPLELHQLMQEWLEQHRPLAAAHVMSLMRASRGGKDDDSRFHHRMRGQGPYAALIRARFEKAARRLGLATGEGPPLDCTQFRPPSAAGQLSLW